MGEVEIGQIGDDESRDQLAERRYGRPDEPGESRERAKGRADRKSKIWERRRPKIWARSRHE